MTAYYNEVDKFAAAWLRELIAAGHIAHGVVDERPIQEVKPSDVEGFTQCHFFAGIGGWSAALRLAGWDDRRAVWTGSCPCQPFSASGRKRGFDDARHLWPVWFRLIRKLRPPVIFGEQVASEDGLIWLDLVSADVEAEDYSIGAADLCAAGVGAPTIRQRLFFVAESCRERCEGVGLYVRERRPEPSMSKVGGRGQAGSLADVGGSRLEVVGEQQARRECTAAERGGAAGPLADAAEPRPARSEVGRCDSENALEGLRRLESERGCPSCILGDTRGTGSGRDSGAIPRAEGQGQGSQSRRIADVALASGLTRDPWRGAEWIYCRDGKARPVESGTFPLASGVPARVGRLRGYGNSIVPQVGATFVEAYLDVEASREPEAEATL